MNFKKLLNENTRTKLSVGEVAEFIDAAPSLGKVKLQQKDPYTIRVIFKALDNEDYMSRMKLIDRWSNIMTGFELDVDFGHDYDYVDLYYSEE